MLDKEKISYEKRNLFGEIDQLYFDWCGADVVCHLGSYGGPRSLFEVMGDCLLLPKLTEKNTFTERFGNLVKPRTAYIFNVL